MLRRLAVGLLGIGTVLAWVATVIAALTRTPWLIVYLAGALVATAVFYRVRPKQYPGGNWDAALRSDILALAPGTKVRRSRAGRPALAASLGWGVYVVGVIAGAMMAGVGAVQATLVCIGGGGFVAGALFAVARDGRGRTMGLRAIVVGPLVLAAMFVWMGIHEASSARDWWSGVLPGFGAALATGVPVLVGFLVPRGLAALYRSTRGIDAMPATAAAALPPELERATEHRRAAAIGRIYSVAEGPDDEGYHLLDADKTILKEEGYVLVRVCESNRGARGLTQITKDIIRYGGTSDRVVALFVQRTELGAPRGAGDRAALGSWP